MAPLSAKPGLVATGQQTSKKATLREKHPELYTEDTMIDPRTRTRNVPMEVLSLGFSRTGTASMQRALEILGYPCYHGFTVFCYSKDAKYWLEGLNAKYFPEESPVPPFGRQEFDHLLADYRACCDFPSTLFAEDLIAAYPDAKVVMVEREIESWYKSFEDVVIVPMYSPLAPMIALLDGHMDSMNRMARPWTHGQFKAKNIQEFRENARPVYKEHYRKTREIVPPKQLLNFDLKDGWGPLCEFLGKEVPDVPFPRVNEGLLANEKVLLIVKKAFLRFLRKVALVVGALAAVGLAYWWS